MGAEFVSREETDLLLNGVSGDAQADAAREAPEAGPADLVAQQRIERGRMPALELVNERFARLVRKGLSDFLRRGVEVTLAPTRFERYSRFIDELNPGILNLVQVQPIGATALIVFDAGLVYSVIDTLFGGTGRAQSAPGEREPTPTEQRIIQRLLEVVLESYEKAWSSLHPLKLGYLRTETNARFAPIAAANDKVVATAFQLASGSAAGAFHVCLPYQPLEPLRDLLYSVKPGEVRRTSADLLAGQVQLAEVELTVQLASAPATLRQVLGMKAGEVIAIDIPEHIVAHVDGVPVMECKYGVHNGQYALKVVRWIKNPASDMPTGERHV